MRLTKDGRQEGSYGRHGVGVGQFVGITALALLSTGGLVVREDKGSRIQVLGPVPHDPAVADPGLVDE